MDATAIVVGVDDYGADTPGLDGSVADALDVTAWLLEVGTPPERVFLHIAPKGAQPATPPGVNVAGASRDEIWDTVAELHASKAKGERLFVFLSGHGYYLAASGPIFLCADYSKKRRSKNLDIRRYAEFFQGLGFANTLFVVDACQNYDKDPSYRSSIQPSGPDIADVQAKPSNGLLLLCAAEQEQYAPVVDGRGLLTRSLLTALRGVASNLKRQAGPALLFDWTTGRAQVDLMPLFQFSVMPDVSTAAQKAGQRQNPTMQPFGRASSRLQFITHALSDLPTVELALSVQDAAGVDSIVIRSSPPVSELSLSGKPGLPFKGFAPKGRRLDADCNAIADWTAEPTSRSVAKADGLVSWTFDVRRPVTAGADGLGAAVADINIRMVDRTGAPAWEVQRSDYESLAAAVRGIAADPSAARRGVPYIVSHESGPDVVLNGASARVGLRKARAMQSHLTALVSRRHAGASFVVTPPGKVWSRPTLPNLKLRLPKGGAAGLAGRLTAEPMIRLERLDRVGPKAAVMTLSADDVAAQPWRRIAPGSYRLIVATPWGEGVEMVMVGSKSVAVTVPWPVGETPLRNRMTAAEVRRLARTSPPLYALGQGDAVFDAAHLRRVELPPWRNGTLLFSEEPSGVRVEPYSELPWPEWDQLLSIGRLQGIDLNALLKKIRKADWADPGVQLMRVAAGYAAWSQNNMGVLGALLGLGQSEEGSSDLQLLSLARDGLTSRKRFDPPLLRWGAGLAALVAPQTRLPGPVSPASAWAVYEAT